MNYDEAHIATGWSYHELYKMACSFLLSMNRMEAFEDYLEGVAAEEEEECDDGF